MNQASSQYPQLNQNQVIYQPVNRSNQQNQQRTARVNPAPSTNIYIQPQYEQTNQVVTVPRKQKKVNKAEKKVNKLQHKIKKFSRILGFVSLIFIAASVISFFILKKMERHLHYRDSHHPSREGEMRIEGIHWLATSALISAVIWAIIACKARKNYKLTSQSDTKVVLKSTKCLAIALLILTVISFFKVHHDLHLAKRIRPQRHMNNTMGEEQRPMMHFENQDDERPHKGRHLESISEMWESMVSQFQGASSGQQPVLPPKEESASNSIEISEEEMMEELIKSIEANETISDSDDWKQFEDYVHSIVVPKEKVHRKDRKGHHHKGPNRDHPKRIGDERRPPHQGRNQLREEPDNEEGPRPKPFFAAMWDKIFGERPDDQRDQRERDERRPPHHGRGDKRDRKHHRDHHQEESEEQTDAIVVPQNFSIIDVNNTVNTTNQAGNIPERKHHGKQYNHEEERSGPSEHHKPRPHHRRCAMKFMKIAYIAQLVVMFIAFVAQSVLFRKYKKAVRKHNKALAKLHDSQPVFIQAPQVYVPPPTTYSVNYAPVQQEEEIKEGDYQGMTQVRVSTQNFLQ